MIFRILALLLVLALLFLGYTIINSEQTNNDLGASTIYPQALNIPNNSINTPNYSRIHLGELFQTTNAKDYDSAAVEFENKYGIAPGFANWMIDNKNNYSLAFNKSRSSKNITVAVYYYKPIDYNPRWNNETEHMAALENMVELAFPTWDFRFIFNGDKSTSDVVVYLGWNGSDSYANVTSKELYLIYETIFTHEFAHLFGIPHHYLAYDASDAGKCSFCPPGEGKCIMDRNSEQWGPAEHFAFDIPVYINNGKRIVKSLQNITFRYPHQKQ